jgi:KaiC/GvpD/RAD55 family RecA-like ATPase
MTKTIGEQIEDARKKLLDLGLRNRLLNYKPTRARTIRILNTHTPVDVYDALVFKEKALSFRPSTRSDNSTGSPVSSPSSTNPTDIAREDFRQPLPSVSISSTPIKENEGNQNVRSLDTPYDPDELSRRLLKSSRESKSILEEQGYTAIYLALWFLEWIDPVSPDTIWKSPLILIPIELKRQGVRENFQLKWTGAEITTNESLKEKLKQVGVILPDFAMPEEKAYVDNYFSQVEHAIGGKSNWKICHEIYLDFFTFTKFVMYKDLNINSWPGDRNPINHPLMKAIFDPDPNIPQIPGFNENDVDKIKAESVYHILDADSSQIAVIEDIKAGRNLVVEGPPGTGKSQTIANAIADLLAKGKTVLFISEKMAALEVVKDRLDNVRAGDISLGDFCLAVHSRKATIGEVHKTLQKSLSIPPILNSDFHEQYQHNEELKDELNRYVDVLHSPVGNRGLTPYMLIGQFEKESNYFSDKGRDTVYFLLQNVSAITEQEWQKAHRALGNVATVLSHIRRPVQRHPWYGCKKRGIFQTELVTVESSVKKTLQALDDLETKMEKLSKLTGLSYPNNLEELEHALNSTDLLTSSDPIDRDLLLNEAWINPPPQVAQIIEQITIYNQMKVAILRRFETKVMDEDFAAFLKEFVPLSQKFVVLKYLSSRYRALRQQASAYYLDHQQHTDTEIFNDLTYIQKCSALKKQIRQAGHIGRSLFGSRWQDELSDPQKLKAFSDWIVKFRKNITEKVFTIQTVEMVSRGFAPDEISSATNDLKESWRQFLSLRYDLFELLAFQTKERFVVSEEQLEFSKYRLLFDLWANNTALLIGWSNYVNVSEDCKSTFSGQVLNSIEEQDIPPEDIIPAFERSYADQLLKIAFQEHPELSGFNGDTHEQTIRKFRELDKNLIKRNKLRLIYKLCENKPYINDQSSPSTGLAILKDELRRQRGRKPIRELIKRTGNVIQKINPCFMMSPLAVAMFLDPSAIQFDVIIFDEASQVRPEEAMGALLRGKQAVVIGDPKQLPPTTFFDTIIDEDQDPDDLDDISISLSQRESILELCGGRFPTKSLRWHYRSRHESLIALSNAEFYSNTLLVYPSPKHRVQDTGLELIHLPDTEWDKSKTNKKEAEAVAKAVFKHYSKYGDKKSLGVGTFGMNQQQAIQDYVDLLRRNQPEMEHFFREDNPEHFFVKNLETIQGDERDVIFISVGYAKDKLTKELKKQFGPLNKSGGERRLNVLITRARERCVVFSNFTASDLELKEDSSFGVRVLKHFLAYAESGSLPDIENNRSGETESPFEDAVKDFLEDHHHKVEPQVGCAGFRIDLAIIDPLQPGRYILGIECDGAQYHSSRVARDRDRLRQEILEDHLGWKIHRVWSTDWWHNPADTQQKLLDAIEKIKSMPDVDPTPVDWHPPQKEPDDIPLVIMDNSKRQESNGIQPYRFCATVDLRRYSENFLLTIPRNILHDAITEIVSVEGPIHFEDLCLRIKKVGNISKMNPRIKQTIRDVCNTARINGRIKELGWFLWPVIQPENILRRRNSDQEIDISWICDEEIHEAICYILGRQYATEKEELIKEVLKIFGFQRSSDQTKSAVRKIIQMMIAQGVLVELAESKIDLKKTG